MKSAHFHILLVEDSSAQARMIKNLVEANMDSPYDLDWVMSLNKGMEVARLQSYDIILLDLLLPDSDGLDTFRWMQHVTPVTPIIILTGVADKSMAVDAVKLGAQDFLFKAELNGVCLVRAIFHAVERKKLELAFRENEQRYRSLFDNSMDTIFECSPDGDIVDINSAGVKLLGYESTAELCSLNMFDDLYYNQNDKNTFLTLMQSDGYVRNFKHALKRKNGKRLVVFESSKSICNDAGKIILFRGIIRDMSEHEKNQKLLERMNASLKATNKRLVQTQANLIHQEKLASIGQLAAGMAHELNNPLGFLTNNFSTLQKYLRNIHQYVEKSECLVSAVTGDNDELPSEVAKQVQHCRKKGKIDFIFQDLHDLFDESSKGFDRMVSIIQSLRNFSRIDAINEVEQFDLNAAIRDTLVIAGNQINHVAETKCSFGDIPLIECHGEEINQVLLNIIVNAAQAIESQNASKPGKISIRTYKKGNLVYCEITDNGPGIAQENIHKLFDPFYTTKEVGKGTGLGLNISYDIIVNKHQGDLFAKSIPGSETTFTIKLPVKLS